MVYNAHIPNYSPICCLCSRVLPFGGFMTCSNQEKIKHLKVGDRCHFHCYSELCEEKAFERAVNYVNEFYGEGYKHHVGEDW